jgi:hypothetical protein
MLWLKHKSLSSIHYVYEKVSTHPGYPYTMLMKKPQHIRSPLFETPRELTKGIEERNTGLVIAGLIGSYTSPYWRSGISSTSVRNSIFSRVERSGTSGKTLNFSHEWKKSQIFNKYECKYLFLPFQLKNKACRFHSFIRMSMSCLLHKILQRYVQCSKYTLI